MPNALINDGGDRNGLTRSFQYSWSPKVLYNTVRSHSERDNLPPIRNLPEEIEKLSLDEIEINSHVGGLVKSFERKAALRC